MMIAQTPLAVVMLLAACIPNALAIDQTKDPQLVAQLRTAATQLDRLALLPTDEDWLFDFTVRRCRLA